MYNGVTAAFTDAVYYFVSLTDVCPTFLAAAGLPVPEDVQGENLLPLLLENKSLDRDFVNSGRERHTYIAHPGHVGYPSRSLRSGEWLLIRNFHPERYPYGDPVSPYSENEAYTDVDDSPTKSEMMESREDEYMSPFYDRTFGLRPGWELYDVKRDPHQFINLAGDPNHAKVLEELKRKMKKWQKATGDRRANGRPTDYWDNFPYFGRTTPAPKVKAGASGKR